MGLRSSLLHSAQPRGRWRLAGESRQDDGFPPAHAGGLCEGLREKMTFSRSRDVPTGHKMLFTSRFQHSRITFVARNDAVELLEIVHLFDRYAQFLYFKSSRVLNDTPFGFGAGMVTGEAVLGVNRRRQIVYFIAWRNGDFK